MENLNIRTVSAKDAYSQLIIALNKYQENALFFDLVLLQVLRDGIIQRFEFTIDALWKALKEQLLVIHKLKIEEIASPRTIFRISKDSGIINLKEFNICMEMIEDRNKTSHTYDNLIAEEVFKSILSSIDTINCILNKIK